MKLTSFQNDLVKSIRADVAEDKEFESLSEKQADFVGYCAIHALQFLRIVENIDGLAISNELQRRCDRSAFDQMEKGLKRMSGGLWKPAFYLRRKLPRTFKLLKQREA